MLDYKTCQDISPKEFKRQCERYGYLVQDAHYRAVASDALGGDFSFFFIAQDKEPPYEVAVYSLDDWQVTEMANLNSETIEEIEYCKKCDYWPQHSQNDSIELTLSDWVLK